MRLSPAIVIGAFALAACGERDTAPTPAVHAEPRLHPRGPAPSSTEKTV
jgi:hypothetical protein